MFPRQLIFWLLWLAVVLGAIGVIVYSSIGKPWREYPTQGAGARALVQRTKPVPTMPPALPKTSKVMPARTYPLPPPYFFAATAIDTNGLESDFSSEVIFTNSATLSNRVLVLGKTVTLAWDASVGSNIAGYTIYRGDASRTYVTNFPAGTNLTLKVPLVRPPPPALLNLVITVTGSTNWTATNPTARIMLFTGHNLTISTRRF